ncbi:monocarboxylate transporter 13-like isoform X2 [Stegodyphus dumicola]|nr:monocarboxylate transporter 13-like isoform X2 [Stegodyphus dumicola]
MEGPDGGWAWLVALAACLINFIMAGLGRMSGILYVAFIDLFHVDRERASLPFSVRSATRNLLGPVVGILGQKYGVRAVTITGGVIGTLSAASCFYAKDIVWITIIWGGINGIGTALTTTLPQVVIGQYFVKHRTTASGMAFSGGCVGSFLFPALLEWLLFEYGMQGTFLIIGAIIMHVIPAAMVLKTAPWLKDKTAEKPMEHVILEEAGPSKCNSNKAYDDQIQINGKTNLTNGGIISPHEEKPLELTKDDSKHFEVDIDYSYLRRHKDLVLKLLQMTMLPETMLAEVSEDSKNYCKSLEEECILEDMERLYRKLEVTKDKNRILDLKHYKNGTIKYECDFEDSSLYRKSQSFTSGKKISNNSGTSSIYKVQSVPQFTIPKGSSHNIFMRLLKLQSCNDDQILSFFLNENHSEVLKLATELRKVYILLNQVENIGHLNPNCENSTNSILSNENSDIIDTTIKSANQQSNSFWIHIKTAFKLHSNPIFLLICLCRAVHFITFVTVVTTVVDFAMDKGLQEADGKYVIAALSLGDLVGRLGLGWLTDRGYISLIKYMFFVMIIQGASTASLPLMYAKSTFLPAIAIFAMLQGSVFVRHPILISSYMGKHEQSIAMGCINFFSGFLGFAIPSYIGYFRDTIGSYDNIFYINGAIGTFIGLLWGFEPYFRRYCPQNAEKNNSIESV